jgi:hypothetical protein
VCVYCPAPRLALHARLMPHSDAKVRNAVRRVMRSWALIKLKPERQLSRARASVEALLTEHPELSEEKMVVLGLKHLYRTANSRDQ